MPAPCGTRPSDLCHNLRPNPATPARSQRASMKLAREEVIAEFEKAGYSVSKEHSFLPRQYFLEFTPVAR